MGKRENINSEGKRAKHEIASNKPNKKSNKIRKTKKIIIKKVRKH